MVLENPLLLKYLKFWYEIKKKKNNQRHFIKLFKDLFQISSFKNLDCINFLDQY